MQNFWTDKIALLNYYKSLGKPFVCLTVVNKESPVSAQIGNFAIIDSDGELVGWLGGACAQNAAKKVARIALLENKPMQIIVGPNKPINSKIHYWNSGCFSGGSITIYAEPFQNSMKKVLIINSNPYSSASFIAQLLEVMGWQAILESYQNLDKITDETDYFAVVIATQGTGDSKALHYALQNLQQSKILFIASGKKWQRMSEELKSDDTIHNKIISDVLCPAGIQVGGKGPQDIAIGVVAQIVTLYNQSNIIQD